MEFFWLLIFMVIVFRVLRLLSERYGNGGKFEGPWGGPFPGGERPWKRAPNDEKNESRPKLNIPEYLTRRSGEPAAGEIAPGGEKPQPAVLEDVTVVIKPAAVEKKEPLPLEEHLAGKAVLPGCPRDEQGGAAPREHRRRAGAGPLDGLVCPGEMIKGVVWSEILGPRGGKGGRCLSVYKLKKP